MNNQIQKIREKLDAYGEKFIVRSFLEELVSLFAPSYTVQDLCRKGLISPLKRGNIYINNISKVYQDPYQTARLYFEGEKYAFGGLGVYAMYGYSTQVIEWYTVYNTRVSGERIIGEVKFIFKKQRESFFYGIVTSKNNYGSYKMLSRERAFIQMLKEGKTFKTLPANIEKDALLKLAKISAPKTVYQQLLILCS